jgi:hypothetical protein
VLGAAQIEHVREMASGGPVGVVKREPELDAIVGERGVDRVNRGLVACRTLGPSPRDSCG